MMELICIAFAVYISTAVITSSSLFYKFREWFKAKTPYLKLSDKHPHYIECRLCVSFAVSVLMCGLYNLSLVYLLPLYGLSYFICTQER